MSTARFSVIVQVRVDRGFFFLKPCAKELPVPRAVSSGSGSWWPHGQFGATFKHQAPWQLEIFWFPTRLKILYCNPWLKKKVLYKLLFALILKLYGTIRHTILKKPTGEIKKSRIATGPGTRKWLQTDREGVSYHYHSKLGEVLAGLWRRVSKRKI